MSKFDDVMATVRAECKDCNVKIGDDLLTGVAKSLGPSIYLPDASRVSCSQASEMETVKKNFLIKKLGLKDGPALDEAIQEVCAELGSSNRNKYRIIVYALLAKKFGKTSMFT